LQEINLGSLVNNLKDLIKFNTKGLLLLVNKWIFDFQSVLVIGASLRHFKNVRFVLLKLVV
jgi:hypothetical protein